MTDSLLGDTVLIRDWWLNIWGETHTLGSPFSVLFLWDNSYLFNTRSQNMDSTSIFRPQDDHVLYSPKCLWWLSYDFLVNEHLCSRLARGDVVLHVVNTRPDRKDLSHITRQIQFANLSRLIANLSWLIRKSAGRSSDNLGLKVYVNNTVLQSWRQQSK